MASGRVFEDCKCPRTTHLHGQRVTYVHHGCRCADCTEAARLYEANRRRQRLYGRTDLVDAEPARQHLRNLSAQGMGWKQVSKIAGIPASTLTHLLWGKYPHEPDHPDHRPPRRQIYKTTAQKILAVTLKPAANTAVDATGARRRVQALVYVGWSLRQIADQVGVDRQRIDRLARNTTETTSVETRDLIAGFFTRAWQAPDDQVPAASVTRAKRLARQRGWLPALAWDDIDDPDEQPDVSALRIGDSTITERIDDLAELARLGHTWNVSTVKRAGWGSLAAAERALCRHGRANLITRLKNNEYDNGRNHHVAV
ncbi:hypothetical protein [Brevibacterium otitidis]|uniref:Homeodomain-like domain-containing protein n=1 Tax=Brevibacterium otitidis TaxID=53364 RepID=A0ABV5X4D8_9MICO